MVCPPPSPCLSSVAQRGLSVFFLPLYLRTWFSSSLFFSFFCAQKKKLWTSTLLDPKLSLSFSLPPLATHTRARPFKFPKKSSSNLHRREKNFNSAPGRPAQRRRPRRSLANSKLFLLLPLSLLFLFLLLQTAPTWAQSPASARPRRASAPPGRTTEAIKKERKGLGTAGPARAARRRRRARRRALPSSSKKRRKKKENENSEGRTPAPSPRVTRCHSDRV